MVTASHWVGLTLPGMMEEPGSFSGMVISPRPSLGPEASQRMSLAIFIRSAARAFRAPWAKTSSDLEVRAWNLLGAVTKFLPVSSDSAAATAVSKPLGAFRPVPTAVPPRASSFSPGRAAFNSCTSFSRLLRQPEISWEKEMGVASCRWVRPDLTMPSFSLSRPRKAAISSSVAGITRSSRA